MSKIKGINISAPIVPFTTNDNYPTHIAKFGKGGFISVNTIEERDSIPEERLEEGMMVFVKNCEIGEQFFQYINNEWKKSDLGKLNNLDFDSNDVFNAKVENGRIVVRNELAKERLPRPTTRFQYSNLKINSFYLGEMNQKPSEHNFLPCSHYFIELSNIGEEDIPLLGLYLMFTDNTLDENSELVWNKLKLTGIVKSGSTYLIRGPQCSILNSPTTKIKVEQLNQEWLDLTCPSVNGAMIYLCWCTEEGYIINESGTEIETPQISQDLYGISYVDLVCIGQNMANTEIEESLSRGTKNKIFVRRYPLDPNYQDTRKNDVDWRFHYIVDDMYRPAASYEGKTILWGNDWFKEDKPTTITCTVGSYVNVNYEIPRNAVRCFTWTSLNNEDEFLWIRERNSQVWQKIVSFQGNTTIDALGNLHNKSTLDNNSPVQPLMYIYNNPSTLPYYNRVTWEALDGWTITTHRVLVEISQEGEYEYRCGKDNGHLSESRYFTVYDDLSEFGLSDIITVGNLNIANREEANLWELVSNEILSTIDLGRLPLFMLNTGNLVKNGNRPQEWIYYINNNKVAEFIPEFITPGANDLGEVNLYDLGKEKVNYKMMDMFYTFELGPEDIPMFEGKVMPGLYCTRYQGRSVISLNSTIISNLKDEGIDTVRDVMDCADTIDIDTGNLNGYATRYYFTTINWLYNTLCTIIGDDGLKIDPDQYSIDEYLNANFIDAPVIIVSNRCPVEPYSTYLRDRFESTRSDDLTYDNLNKRFSFFLSRLLKIWNIKRILGQNDWVTEITKPIFDAPYDFDPSFRTSDWELALIGDLENPDTFIPVVCVYTEEEAVELLRNENYRIFWNGLSTRVNVDGKEFAAYSRNENPAYTSRDEGDYSLILVNSSDREPAPKYIHLQSSLLTFGTEELNQSTVNKGLEWYSYRDTRLAENEEFGPEIIIIESDTGSYDFNFKLFSLNGILKKITERPYNNLWNEEVMRSDVYSITLDNFHNELI